MKLTKTLITTALLSASIFSFQSTAWADTPEQQLQQGLTAYKQSDYQTAFKLWLPLAEQGDAKAQFNLGNMYLNGRGVKQDDFEAVKWYRKAAEQGDAEAQANLGSAYTAGRGVRQDDTEAVKWVTKAAENGSAAGQFKLGVAYLLGLSVQKDRTLAKEWLGKACDNGDQQGCEFYGKLNRGEL
ncbi:tetratricopeptide repeat protein [Haemophilus parahaemolyticus]|uniref:tetratricopeptide repeat protein n=1 Tax=Haemophilus parahaemolyticus TaxID=735 RepID=UPI0028D4BE96|nr:tetratricopeptide repeat protein [Haemophilus parahaemolyticus]